MNSENRIEDWRAGALAGLFLAALGFSYALATSVESRGVSGPAGARAALVPLRFSNPFLPAGTDPRYPAGGEAASDPQGFDLGDACLGPQLARYVNALGGYQPYMFISDTIGSSGSAGLWLEPSGRVTGTALAGTEPAAFNVDVIDAEGTWRTGYFRIGPADSTPGVFRFALDRLPAAQVGVDYITNLQTVGGDPQSTWLYVVPGSERLNGAQIWELEYAGLTLYGDGTLAGRPLASGTLSFTARAFSGPLTARDRSNTREDQELTVTIAPEASVQSALATTSALLKGDRAKPDKGALTLRAQLNLDGYFTRDFAHGRFALRLGGVTFETTLDGSARARSGNLRVSLDTVRGRLGVQLRNTDTTALFDPRWLTNGGTKTAVAEIELGTTFRAAEPLEFAVRSNDRMCKLQYRLGKQRPLGGLFQITRVKAAESFEGTAYRADFLIAHVQGRSDVSFGLGTQATVYVGPGFQTTVPLYGGKGKFYPPGLRSMQVAPAKLKGVFQTYPLTEAETGIPRPSLSGGKMQTFLLSLDLTTSTTFFSGDASQRIFPIVTKP